MSNGVQV